VAVLLVVLLHALFRMPGGFIGVDIFFAISGFLITGIIVRELLSGRFSLLQFYRRRIRRIFPDRCACAVLALGWLWMLPVA
jgi:peptidoglycan/LPS O-acetylase OafA/YrhL